MNCYYYYYYYYHHHHHHHHQYHSLFYLHNVGRLPLHTLPIPCYYHLYCCSCSVLKPLLPLMLLHPTNTFLTFTLALSALVSSAQCDCFCISLILCFSLTLHRYYLNDFVKLQSPKLLLASLLLPHSTSSEFLVRVLYI